MDGKLAFEPRDDKLKNDSLVACNRKEADRETDKVRVSETESNEEAAHPLQVVIFTPLGAGGQGGVDRMMDELRGALKMHRFSNTKPYFITTRGPGSIF